MAWDSPGRAVRQTDPWEGSTARMWTVAGTTERHTAGCYTSATIPLITMREADVLADRLPARSGVGSSPYITAETAGV